MVAGTASIDNNGRPYPTNRLIISLGTILYGVVKLKIDHNMSLSTIMVCKFYDNHKHMLLICWWFWWPWRCASTVPIALTYALCSALQFKPLDPAIGRVFALYHPGNRQGPIQTSKKHNKKNAPHLLIILMAMAARQYSTKRIDTCVVLSASI